MTQGFSRRRFLKGASVAGAAAGSRKSLPKVSDGSMYHKEIRRKNVPVVHLPVECPTPKNEQGATSCNGQHG